MDLHWRGWGISVFLLFVFWIFAVIALVVFAAPYVPDRSKAMLTVQWLFAGMFALLALSVFAVVLCRRWRPPAAEGEADPHADEFMFIRLDLWPYILLCPAAVFAGTSWLGYLLFE